jgi:hypothetical protein
MKPLADRWFGQEDRVRAILDDVRSDRDWTRHLLFSETRGWEQLPMLDTCPRRFRVPGEATARDLRGIKLRGLDLSGADGLANACLDHAVLHDVALASASLVGTSLVRAQAKGRCSFSEARMYHADLRGADFRSANFEGADLTGADMRGADFRDAILVDTALRNVVCNSEHWAGFAVPHAFSPWTRFGGEYQSPTRLDPRSGALVTRSVAGGYHKWLMVMNHPVLGRLWYVLTNCGHSAGRLLFWVIIVWVLFGTAFAALSPGTSTTMAGKCQVILMQPVWRSETKELLESYSCALYLSAIVLTSLGLAETKPALDDWRIRSLVALESVLGYVFLALFVGLLLQNAGYYLGPRFSAPGPRRQ